MRKKLIILAFAMALGAALLAGCSGKEKTTDTAEKESAAAAGEEGNDSLDEVSFALVIKNTVSGEERSIDETTDKSTLGDFMRGFEDCVWEDGPYGFYITSIDGVEGDTDAMTFWSFYVDGEYSLVGADEVKLEDGMEIAWVYEGMEW